MAVEKVDSQRTHDNKGGATLVGFFVCWERRAFAEEKINSKQC